MFPVVESGGTDYCTGIKLDHSKCLYLNYMLIFRWLQPDRAVDPKASELVIPDEPIKTGVSSNFIIHTKDQDGKLVYVEGMKVDIFCSMPARSIGRPFLLL